MLKACPQCHSHALFPIGLGTQRLEQTLLMKFPQVPIIRIDKDTTSKKDSLTKLMDQINLQQAAILLGTQILAKGHHFPNVTLVGIIDADSGLFSADFHAAEKMGQLFLQVAGRAGRAEKKGKVLIQTRYPDHPFLQSLVNEGYPFFADALMKERKSLNLPPFCYFAVIRAEAYKEETVENFLITLKNYAEEMKDFFQILGPLPALMPKKKGLFCQNLVFKSSHRFKLQTGLSKLQEVFLNQTKRHSVKWVLDVDPVEM
jgi:primosomal protein N' (replication factor Y)